MVSVIRATQRPIGAAILAGALIASLTGCAAPRSVGPSHGAHVLVLPGIGGTNPIVERLPRIINAELPGTSARVWDWTRIEPIGMLGDLVDVHRNRRRAAELARQLSSWRLDHPRTRLYVIATSGGAGIVLFAFRQLPADFRVERVLFLSAALAPDVDLAPILTRSRLGLFNYYSANDRWILGIGTEVFGTTDRRHERSAGFAGFDPPADPRLARKLVQLAWTDRMRRLGNDGGHLGAFAPGFIREVVLPLLNPAARP